MKPIQATDSEIKEINSADHATWYIITEFS